jgi:hypothetical protein
MEPLEKITNRAILAVVGGGVRRMSVLSVACSRESETPDHPAHALSD